MTVSNHRNLSVFLDFLEKRGELHRISAPVSADLEITEITDRIVKEEGPALLFENVEGSSIPLVTNIMGTAERMAWALGVDDIEEELAKMVACGISGEESEPISGGENGGGGGFQFVFGR